MQNLEVILPFVLLILGFLLKLLVGRSWDTPRTIQSVCELPVDIIFLALSFTVAFTISKTQNQAIGLLYCLLGIIFSILIVFLWKVSLDMFNRNKKIWLLILLVNLFISGYGIRESVKLIIGNQATIKTIDTNRQNNTQIK